MTNVRHPLALMTALFALLAAGASTAFAASTCSVRSAAVAPPVVELYTSEGCSSCPPADRWLSGLKTDTSVVALAFHVDYWDSLGWKDRFASAAYTRRQAEQQAVSGARFSYTPQVIVNGVDRPGWSRSTVASNTRPSSVGVMLTRAGDRVDANVTPAAGAPSHLAAYWAVTEQAHVSAVKSGENEGATLAHDFVVRTYQPVPAWAARPGADVELHLELPGTADPAHPRSVNLVVVDADTGRPVQAVKMGC